MTDYERYGEYLGRDRTGVGAALTFLFIGLGVGALVGLLVAPKTGKQMRRSLRRKYEDARGVVEDWTDQAGDMIEKGAGWANAAKEKVAPIGKVIMKQAR